MLLIMMTVDDAKIFALQTVADFPIVGLGIGGERQQDSDTVLIWA